MLEACDRIQLASGVVLREGRLDDDVARTSWPVNTAGAFVLAQQGHALADVANDVAATYALPVERATTDVLAFAWELNRLALANVDRDARRIRQAVTWLRLAIRLAPAGVVPSFTVHRHPLDTSTVPRAVRGVLRSLAGRCSLLSLVATVLVAHMGLVAGHPSLALPAIVGVAVGGGIAGHEAAHAAALRGLPSALVVRGSRVSVLHAPAGRLRRVLVALAGPGIVAVAGATLLAAAIGLGIPALAAAGGPAALHAVGLTVLASDGRTACGLPS